MQIAPDGAQLTVRAGCHRSTLTTMRAMGVDVSVARGLDMVVLDEPGGLVQSRATQTLPELESALRELRPDIVAIDSPPGWASAGRSRPLERQLARLGGSYPRNLNSERALWSSFLGGQAADVLATRSLMPKS